MSPHAPHRGEPACRSFRARSCRPTIAADAYWHRAHRPGRVSSRAPGVLRRHPAALGQALGDIRAVTQEHRPARRAEGPARPVHIGGARRRAARARHRRDPRAAGRRDRHRRGVCAPHARAIRASSRSPSRKKATASTRTICSISTNADIAHDLANPAQPRSTIGWLVEGLRRRRAQGVPPFTVLSCDNLPENGSVLHRALVAFAARARCRSRQLDRSRSRLPAHHGRQHHAGHGRRAAQARAGAHGRSSTNGPFSASHSRSG